MRDGYTLVDANKGYQQWLLSPIGEKIALGTDDGDGKFFVHSGQLKIRLTDKDHATMREAYVHAAERHYQVSTTRSERFRNWITKWSPVWVWIYGAAATIAAFWGWID